MGRSRPDNVSRQNLRRLSISGNTFSRFSKSKRLTRDRLLTKSENSALVVSSVAMPEGTIIPARPEACREVAESLREDGVGIDVAAPCERESPAAAHETAGRLRVVPNLLQLQRQRWVVLGQPADEALTGGLVGRARDFRVAASEELLLL